MECWEHRKGWSAGGAMGINEWERTDEDEDIGGVSGRRQHKERSEERKVGKN